MTHQIIEYKINKGKILNSFEDKMCNAKNINQFLNELIEKFDLDDFKPREDYKDLFYKIKKLFTKDQVYWTYYPENSENIKFQIKTFEINKDEVYFSIKINKNKIEFSVESDEKKLNREEINFEEIWVNLENLAINLRSIVACAMINANPKIANEIRDLLSYKEN